MDRPRSSVPTAMIDAIRPIQGVLASAPEHRLKFLLQPFDYGGNDGYDIRDDLRGRTLRTVTSGTLAQVTPGHRFNLADIPIDAAPVFDPWSAPRQSVLPRPISEALRSGDVLLGRTSPFRVGVVGEQEENLHVTGGVIVLRPKPMAVDPDAPATPISIDPDYLGWYLSSPRATHHFDCVAKTGSRLSRHIDRDDVLALQIPVPAPEHQQSIVSVFRTLDRVLDVQERAVALSRELRGSLTESLW